MAGDKMPDALIVNCTAARIEQAWWAVHPLQRVVAGVAMATSLVVATRVGHDDAQRAGIAMCGVLLSLAALVDVHEARLPNRVLALAALAAFVWPIERFDPQGMARTAGGLLLAGAAFGAVRITRGLGMGDVKMAAVVGASAGGLSLRAPLVAVGVASFAAASYGIARRRRRVVLGPALWLGWALAILGTSTGWWR